MIWLIGQSSTREILVRTFATACYVGAFTTLGYLLTADVGPLPGTAFEVIFGSLPPIEVLLVLLARAGLVFGFVTMTVWGSLSFSDWR